MQTLHVRHVRTSSPLVISHTYTCEELSHLLHYFCMMAFSSDEPCNEPHTSLQLCGKWTPAQGRRPDRWLVQPKVDGVRCLIGPFGDDGQLVALSRHGHTLSGCAHIVAELDAMQFRGILDGELYDRDWSHTISAIRSPEPTSSLILFAFDMMSTREWMARKCTGTVQERTEQLGRLVAGLTHTKRLQSIETSGGQVCKVAAQYRREGFEGAVAKRLDARYAFGSRGDGWYKCKPIDTVDCTILDIDLDGVPCVIVKTPAGVEQRIYHGLTHEVWEQIAAGGPGALLEVKCLGERWRRGLLAPVALRVRPAGL